MKLSIELEVLVLVLNLASTSILEQGGPKHSSYSLLVEQNLAAAPLKCFEGRIQLEYLGLVHKGDRGTQTCETFYELMAL